MQFGDLGCDIFEQGCRQGVRLIGERCDLKLLDELAA